MKRLTVRASKQYDVLIGPDLLMNIHEHISKLRKTGKIAIISDSNVWPYYGNVVADSLTKAGFKCVRFVFPAGESSKTIGTYLEILNFLADAQITRSDLIISLGGGVVGDITGFAAATFLRGVDYIQIPTSLLAMVDSSVGGKTAIDLPIGKNLVGAFKQPVLVLCDTTTLSTLPQDQFLDGCAEIIKYAMLYDAALFEQLQRSGTEFDKEDVIAKCISFKRNVIQQDEFDNGERQKLNFGHTLGHGVEAASNFSITHGRAVAIGMSLITKAATFYGLTSCDTFDQLVALLEKFSLPTSTAFDAEILFEHAQSDKKRSGGSVNLIVPTKIGNCVIHPLSIGELKSFIKAGL